MTTTTTATPESPTTDRRKFLQASASIGAGLAIGLHLPALQAKTKSKAHNAAMAAAGASAQFEPNAWVRVFPDNKIRLIVHKHDSGTGVHTSLGMMLAEELDVALSQVEVVPPSHPFYQAYIHPQWKVFSTGGSTSVMLEYEPLRKAGAAARMMLVQAAAQQWKVPESACVAQNAQVVHKPTGRKLSYGALAEKAAKLQVPTEIKLKNPEQFTLIGKHRQKLHVQSKVMGKHQYSIDVKLPGMLVAVIAHSPVVNGRVRSIDDKQALAVPGVRQVVKVPAAPADLLGGNQEGVAVLADSYWAAKRGRDALVVEWNDGEFAGFNSNEVGAQQKAFLASGKAELVPTVQSGNVADALKQGGKVLEAEYFMPYKAQLPLEPECVVVQLAEGKMHFWAGLQVPSNALTAAQTVAGLGPDDIVLHDLTGGGSFGAREARHWLIEGAYLAKATGKPVKLMYSREDEMRQLYYHAASYSKLAGAVDENGKLTALQMRAVAPASPEMWEPGYFDRKDKMDYSTTESITAWDYAYKVPNTDIGWVRHETGMPTGWYRAVSFIPNVFATESFMDELAHAAGQDALAFRKAHMVDRPRHVAALDLAASKAGWGKPLGANRALGIATNQGYTSYIAIVAEVEKQGENIAIKRITCVVDCGLAVQPSGVEEQIYGGIVWGLGHALYDKLDIENGKVVQSNFTDYPVVRMSDMPEVDITILQGDTNKPGGVGELSNPGVVPAIANAIFNLTGKRQRSTPLVMKA